ncbi:MAG: WcaI family glycosyltransferase [Gammaproteobacteria bacterium]|nr:WcaI family glycosyltransferase [Gammaproteobacteria bacterium]MDH5801229.1 WcaI family glycosyltransferase [Gammaproteobacteria bacterium]
MKILLVSLNYTPELTGIGKYSGELVEWLVSKGHEVTVVTTPPYYPNWEVWSGFRKFWYSEARHLSECVIRCPIWVPKNVNGIKRIFHLLSFAISSLPIILLQARKEKNVVFLTEPPLFCAPVVLFAARFFKIKTWLHVQDLEVDAAVDLGIIKNKVVVSMAYWLERNLVRKFHIVSTISKNMQKRIEAKGVKVDNQVYFPNWVDCETIKPMETISDLRQSLNLEEGAVVAVYSGNFGEKQGLEIVIDAAKELKNRNIVFLMCGQGAVYKKLRQYAGDLPTVYWLPLQPVEKLNDLLNTADIHLLPQRDDVADLVMPSKLSGIMASGKPCVATAKENTQVWRILQGCGIVTPPADLEAFVRAILELSNNQELRNDLGRNARHYAESNLDKETVLTSFESRLSSMI